MNEILLILSLIISFFSVLFFLKVFDKSGLFVWIAIGTVFANIEVTVLVKAFGLTQTLGNTLFASTFLATDILSECFGKKYADKGVKIGVFTMLSFILFSVIWIFYVPADNDWAMSSIKTIFSHTPRILLFSLTGFIISEYLDVFLYHKIWQFTSNKCGNKDRFLWVRNNVATLISQFINIVIFNFGSFYKVYGMKELISLTFVCYLIYIITSLLDTPFVYLAKIIVQKKNRPAQRQGRFVI